jgi:AbrB family looped-hinge helix DNA binding protein
MQTIKSRLDGAGRLVIPTPYRKALHLKPGEEVMITLDNNEIRVCSFKEAAIKARDIIAAYNNENVDLMEILFKQRKEDLNYE